MDQPVPVMPSESPAQALETYESLARLLDWRLLDPMLSTDHVAAACRQAREYGIRAVVVRPCDVELVAEWTRNSGLVLAAAVNHPDGTSTTAVKLYETRDLLRLGATEIEFVLNPVRMISRQFQHVETELMQAVKACRDHGARITVVYNNRHFADDLKIIATKIARRVEVDVLGIDGIDHDVELLKPLLKDALKLKLSSGVDDLDQALAARDVGYWSIATTSPLGILDEWKKRLAEQKQTQSPAT